MPGTHAPYPPEFRRQIVDLVRSGRSIEELAKEFEPSSGAIRNWVKQADLDEGRRSDGLTTEERDELRQLRRENKRLRMEQEILKRPLPGLLGRATRSRSGVRVREDESGRLSGSVDVPRVGTLPHGYYAWVRRPPSARAKRDAELVLKIRKAYDEYRQVYGRPRLYAELKEAGEVVGEKRVGRLMKQEGIWGASRRRRGPKTTRRNADARPVVDLVERNFTVDGPDQLWIADITYIPASAGFLYLAVVLDAWSRRVIGWAMATHLRTELVLDSLNMAVWQRRSERVIHHSDQGTQYTSIAFGLRCREVGVRPSMGSVGDAYDNALCESFFATLECELLDRKRFQTQTEAKMAVFDFIEGFYNPRRRHSSLGQVSPVNFERRHAREAAA